jgi:hypothetical protein
MVPPTLTNLNEFKLITIFESGISRNWEETQGYVGANGWNHDLKPRQHPRPQSLFAFFDGYRQHTQNLE